MPSCPVFAAGAGAGLGHWQLSERQPYPWLASVPENTSTATSRQERWREGWLEVSCRSCIRPGASLLKAPGESGPSSIETRLLEAMNRTGFGGDSLARVQTLWPGTLHHHGASLPFQQGGTSRPMSSKPLQQLIEPAPPGSYSLHIWKRSRSLNGVSP